MDNRNYTSEDLTIDLNFSITNEDETAYHLAEISLKKALRHWKESGVGREIKTNKTNQCKKQAFSAIELLKLGTYPQGLNTSIATYLDLGARLLFLIAFLVVGNAALMFQTREGYCEYLSMSLEGVNCDQKFSLYSYLIDYVTVLDKLGGEGDNLNNFFNSIKIGIILSILTVWALPVLFLWLFKQHYELGLKVKHNSRKVKKIENFTLLLNDFKKPGDLRRDFEAEFESLMQENGFSGESKIVKSVYSTDMVKAGVLREEAEILEEEMESSVRGLVENKLNLDLEKKLVKKVSKMIKKGKKKLKKLEKRSKKLEEELKGSYLLSICVHFVTLSSSLTRDKIQRSFKNKYPKNQLSALYRLCRNRTPNYSISEAPAPTNINWANFGTPRFTIFTTRILSYFLVLGFFLCFLVGLEYIIETIQENTQSNDIGPTRIKDFFAGSIGMYLFLELVQSAATLTTRIICSIFSLDFMKTELIFSQGMWLGVLKVLTLIPLRKILIIFPQQAANPVVFLEKAFQVILTQSLLKPTMKVFGLRNVVNFIRMSWIRLRFCFGSKPVMTQNELNRVFSKPGCYLQYLYCEDIYITTIGFLSSAFNPGGTVACLAYFFVKIVADRFLFLRFYADLEVDSIRLSVQYFKLVPFLIRLSTLHSIYRQYYHNYDYGDNTDRVIRTFWIFNILRVCTIFFLLFPYEFFMEYICRRAEKRDFLNRAKRGENFCELLDGSEIGVGSRPDFDAEMLNYGYYKGFPDLSSFENARKFTKSSLNSDLSHK